MTIVLPEWFLALLVIWLFSYIALDVAKVIIRKVEADRAWEAHKLSLPQNGQP